MKYKGDSREGCALSNNNIYIKKAQGSTQPQDLYDINLKSAPSLLNQQQPSFNTQINIEPNHQ